MKVVKVISMVAIALLLNMKLYAIENYAVINSQSAISESKAYASFSSQMDAYRKEFEAKVTKEQDSLKKTEQELVNKRNDYAPAEFEKRRKDLETRANKFRDDFQKANQKFEQVGQEVSKSIIDATRQIIAEVVKEKKYEIVYDSMALLYYDQSKDITKDVVKKLDAKLPKVVVKKPY